MVYFIDHGRQKHGNIINQTHIHTHAPTHIHKNMHTHAHKYGNITYKRQITYTPLAISLSLESHILYFISNIAIFPNEHKIWVKCYYFNHFNPILP